MPHRFHPLLVSCLLTTSIACNLSDPAPSIDRAPTSGAPAIDMTSGAQDMTAIDEMGGMMASDMRSPADLGGFDLSTRDMGGGEDMPADLGARDMPEEMGCEPTPEAQICADASVECGVLQADDGCGALIELDCGGCDDPDYMCAQNTCECSAPPPSCPAAPSCGVVMNGCGEQVSCVCGGGEACVKDLCGELVLGARTSAEKARFGHAVHLVGDWLFVGSPRRVVSGRSTAGAVFVFRRDASNGVWSEVQTLTSSSPQEQGLFGTALAGDGSTLFVGEPGYRNAAGQLGAGAVTVFVLGANNLWAQVQRLEPGTASDGASFGTSIALENTELFIGAPRQGAKGVVTRFEETAGSWKESGALSAIGVKDDGLFGSVIVSEGNFAAVSAPSSTGKSGEVFIFNKASGAWTNTQKFSSSSGDVSGFGTSLAMNQEHLLIGAPETNTKGRVSAYYRLAGGTSWADIGTVPIPVDFGLAGFGQAVALGGDRAFVALPTSSNPPEVRAYLFDSGSRAWKPQATFAPLTPAEGAYGSSIASEGSTLAVGTPGQEFMSVDKAGVVHVHDLDF